MAMVLEVRWVSTLMRGLRSRRCGTGDSLRGREATTRMELANSQAVARSGRDFCAVDPWPQGDGFELTMNRPRASSTATTAAAKAAALLPHVSGGSAV